jgi:hypothetical protein
MKINVNNYKFYTLFGELKSGETFYYEPSGVVWMKIAKHDGFYNCAVALDDGIISQFDDEDRVIKVDIKCEIAISNILTTKH